MAVRATDEVRLLEERVAELVGPQRYRLWFKDATHLAVADGFLKVGVPNLFVGNWIENHFSDALVQAAEEVVGRRVDVAITIDASLARNLRKKQPDRQLDHADNYPSRLARARKRSGSPGHRVMLRGRLDRFVVGSSNRLAYNAARSVAEAPATQFSTLFLHGGCGLGKTHLLQGICNEIKERHPNLQCLYVSGEGFTNQFIYSVKNGDRDAFRSRYRNVDVLVLDDIHFFANKRATQEEFLHTFNAIDTRGKQVVLASDAHPKLLGELSGSLVDRFLSGIVVRVDSPDQTLRVEFLAQRAKRMELTLPDEVIDYVAGNLEVNMRELEGALLKLLAVARLEERPITMATAKAALQDHIAHCPPLIRLSDIESIVAIYFGLSPADLHTSRKTRTVALARGIAMFLARKHTDMSFPEIGRFMGNKNHTTVILACRRIEKLRVEDEPVRWLTPMGVRRGQLSTIIPELEAQFLNGSASH